MGDETGGPDLPKLRFKRINEDKALFRAAIRRAGSQEVDALVIRAVRNVAEERYGCEYADSVVQTMLQYTGDKLSARTVLLLSAQLAARYEGLQEGPLGKFMVANVVEEWVPLEILSLMPTIWRETKPGIQLQLECLAGTPAGSVFDRKLPLAWLSYLAYRIGFSRRMIYDDTQPQLFAGLRFFGLMVKLEDRQELDFTDFAVSSAMKKYNQGILKLRLRFELDGDIECPFMLEHECRDCSKTADECPAANRAIATGQEVATVRP